MTARDQFAHELRELITPLGHGGQKEIAERVVNTRDRRSLVVRFSRTSAELERALTRRAQALEKRISTWLQGRAPNKNSDLDAVIDAIAGLTKPPIPHQRRKELKTRLHQLRSKARGEPATPRRSTTPVQPDGGEDVGFGAPAVERDPIQTLGVHQAIRVTSSDRGGQAIENSSTLPAYLERDHDGQLQPTCRH